ncbi:sensor histidine kinase [Streptomyces sp. NPDC048350]|uniref:sensor histidine kinase n=1 Tax=Streptomyces sp. NPDC048350 TaxID=3365538 RepID=UPI00371D05E9
MTLGNRLALAGGVVVCAALAVASLILYPLLGRDLHEQRDGVLVAAADRDASALLDAMARKIKMADGGADGTGTGPGDAPFTTDGDEVRKGDAAKREPAPVKRDPTLKGAQGERKLRVDELLPGKPVKVGSTLMQFVPRTAGPGPTRGFIAVTERDVLVGRGKSRPYFQDAEYAGQRYRVYTASLAPGNGILVRTAVPNAETDETLGELKALLIGITLGGTVLAAAGARLAAGRVLRPVRRLTDTVEHVTQTRDLTARVDVGGRDEIARLARSFTAMMAAVDESVQAQRRLVADASHELRTPLTSLTTNLELLDEAQGVADPQAPALVREARTQAEELKLLVNDLVDLGRYGHAPAHTEDTRLDLLADHVAARAAARSPRVTLRTELTECLVHADPDALERAIGNLVDNAVKWSPEGGEILVRVESCGTVTVTDQGPGIPEDDLPYVFDRFYRSPTALSLPGSGLGLAIVRQVADTHDGTVAAEPLEQGLRMRLSLPALP